MAVSHAEISLSKLDSLSSPLAQHLYQSITSSICSKPAIDKSSYPIYSSGYNAGSRYSNTFSMPELPCTNCEATVDGSYRSAGIITPR